MPPRGMVQVAFAVVRAKVARGLAAHTFFPTSSGCAVIAKQTKTTTQQNKHLEGWHVIAYPSVNFTGGFAT